MPRASRLALLVSLLGGTQAPAQVCRGFAAFATRPIQLTANGLFNAHATSLGAGLAVGNAGPFGELAAARSEGSSLVRADAGYQLSLNERATAQLCPTAGVGLAIGPMNVNGSGLDYGETDFSFGVDAGVSATATTHDVQVVPTGSIAFANAHARFTGRSGSVSTSQSFGVVGLGVGFVFGRAVSVTPSVLRPVGLSGASTSFSIRVAFHFGGPQMLVVPSRPTTCAGLASTDSAVYDTTQLTERPNLRSAPVPAYPPLQRELRIAGQVIMAVVIGPDGTPEPGSARIVRGVDPAIDREALRWIRRASYWPACDDGEPVRARVAQPLDFCLFPPCRGPVH